MNYDGDGNSVGGRRKSIARCRTIEYLFFSGRYRLAKYTLDWTILVNNFRVLCGSVGHLRAPFAIFGVYGQRHPMEFTVSFGSLLFDKFQNRIS